MIETKSYLTCDICNKVQEINKGTKKKEISIKVGVVNDLYYCGGEVTEYTNPIYKIETLDLCDKCKEKLLTHKLYKTTLCDRTQNTYRFKEVQNGK